MGLFGRRKSKNKAAKSSYAPPADPPTGDPVTSEVADSDDDMVKVASVGISESDDGTPETVEPKSVLERVSSVLSAVFSADKADEESPYSEHKDGAEAAEKPKMDDIMDRVTASWAAFLALWFSLSKVIQVSLLAGAALGAVGVVALVAVGGRAPAFPAKINVAFVGNSYFYVNDLPRFVEQIAGGHITQDSVIHNAANILQIIMTGNGMWNKWATKNAMINGVKFKSSSRNTTAYLYDMGACSVPQLLTGHDQMVTYGNRLGSFINDGQNPCFQQEDYREYQESTDLKKSWDFVVITDQSKTMAFEDTRAEALAAFNYTYGPILKKNNISPIILQPHAYMSSGANSTGLDNLATFTALIMEGAQVYKKFLNKRTGMFASAHVAPVGNAFLAVYEESPNDLWPKLFLDDGIHPSAYGTFIYGCVIYATMTGYMPTYKRVVVDDMELSDLFSTARRLQASSSKAGFPTKSEAATLYKIAKKVAVGGYKPKSLKALNLQDGDGYFLRSNSGSDNVYSGDYNGGQQYNQNSYAYNSYQGDSNYGNGGDYNYGGNNGYYEDNAENADDQNANGDYSYNNDGNGNDDAGNADADADTEDGEDQGNGNSYSTAADQYYQVYSQNKNSNNVNGASDYQYGGGNQNTNQYYYSDLTDDNKGD